VRDRIEHFLRAAIDDHNTRRAYGRSLGSFFAFLEDGGKDRLQDIGPLDVRDYLEAAEANGLSIATLKQHMASIRMLFDHLVTGAVLEHNPALSVKAPRQKLGKGKTPVLTAEEAGDLLRSIETGGVVGLRDHALIGAMVFTFVATSSTSSGGSGCGSTRKVAGATRCLAPLAGGLSGGIHQVRPLDRGRAGPPLPDHQTSALWARPGGTDG